MQIRLLINLIFCLNNIKQNIKMLEIHTAVVNNPLFIELQYLTLKKFIKGQNLTDLIILLSFGF